MRRIRRSRALLAAAFAAAAVALAVPGRANAAALVRPLQPCEPPVVVESPVDEFVCAGDAALLAVVAEGDPPLQFQWRKGGVDIDGATDSELLLADCVPADSGTYDCVVSNACGAATSDAAVLTVGDPPVVLQHPADRTLCAGDTLALSVSISGGAGGARTDEVGDLANFATGARIRANLYESGETVRLTRIEQYLNVVGSGEIHFFVYECTEQFGSYTLVADDRLGVNGGGLGYYSSGALSVLLHAGRYYLVGAAWSGSFGYYWSSTTGASVSFGTVVGSLTAAYQDPLPEHPVPNQTYTYRQRLTTIAMSATYQWYHNDALIADANDAQLIVSPVQPADAGEYYVTVANACGLVFSNSAQVAVRTGPPSIVQEPADQGACQGSRVTFAVGATGDGLSYQWKKNGVNISGATQSTYVIASATPAHAGSYKVVIGNTCGSVTSREAALVVAGSAPTITAQPLDRAVCTGGQASFAVTATGTGRSYQWRHDGVAIPGAIEAMYAIQAAEQSDAGVYDVIVSNPCGEVTSSPATLTVDDEGGVLILEQPRDTVACEGAALALTVIAHDALSYQWRKDDQDIPGAVQETLTIDPVQPADAGHYDVKVFNACGMTLSETATVTVDSRPEIAGQPVGGAACVGGDFELRVAATGTPPLAYQWRKDDVPLPGATEPVFVLNSAEDADRGFYDVRVSNSCGEVASESVFVDVTNAAPVILQAPQSQAGCLGQTLTLEVVAEGVGLAYQWALNAVPVDGATQATLTIEDFSAQDAGTYIVVVSNACGVVASPPATITAARSPQIVAQPVGGERCAGEALTLHVVAEGTAPLSYQWRKDSVNIDGATGEVLILAGLQVEDSGDYTVVVTNGCGATTSDVATVTVAGALPEIVEQPADSIVCLDEPVTLSVAVADGSSGEQVDTIGNASSSSTASRMRGNFYKATRSTTLTRIEQYLGISTPGPIVFFVYEAAGSGGPYTLLAETTLQNPGTGTRFHACNPVEVPIQSGRYYIIGAEWAGAHTYYWGGTHPQSTAFGPSQNGFSASYVYPLPQTAPQNANSNVFHQRLTTTDSPLAFQWRKDGDALPGATGGTFTIESADFDDIGLYDVEITNDCGTAVSDAATLAVDATPLIVSQPQDVTVVVGGNATFTVEADGIVTREQVDEIADDTSRGSGPRIRGNSFAVSEDCALLRIEQYLDIATPGSVRYFVYEAHSAGGPYVLRLDDAVVHAALGPQFYASNPVNLDLVAGRFYIVGAAWAEPHGYSWNSAAPVPVTFGQATGSYASAYGSNLPANPVPNSNQLVYHQRLAVALPTITYQWRFGDQDITGATARTLRVESVQPADAGEYSVVITNDCGATDSQPATLTVLDRPGFGGTPGETGNPPSSSNHRPPP